MKKKLLLLSMISILTLAGCGEVAQLNDSDGNNVIVKIGDKNYTANELFNEYSVTATGGEQYFNAVYDVLINKVQNETTSIKQAVTSELDSFIEKAETTAKENNTSSKAELSKALEEAGVEDEAELRQVYLLEKKKEAYEEAYYKKNVNNDLLKEYINYYAPYHIRHILIKTSSGDSLTEGTISKEDATNIASAVQSLADGNITFSSIAKTYSSFGDTTSALKGGDVGIMSTTTSFVSEFKYAIYQYDTLYNEAAKTNVEAYNTRQKEKSIYSGSSLIPYASDSSEVELLKNSINRIDYSVFAELKSQAGFELNNIKDTNLKEEKNLPRNIIFNQYLNNHALGVIRKGTSNSTSNRFQFVQGLSASMTNEKEKILCDEEGRPILVTRAGTGSGDEGYQGIHLIIIQKSPFVKENSETELIDQLVNYYDTEAYTKVSNPNDLNSYVTYLKSSSHDEYDDRANEIKGYVKAIDSYMNYRIYEQALSEAGEVTFGEVNGISIKTLIDNFISSKRYSNAYNAKKEYVNSWNDYIEYLQLQDDVKDLKVGNDTYHKITGKDLI